MALASRLRWYFFYFLDESEIFSFEMFLYRRRGPYVFFSNENVRTTSSQAAPQGGAPTTSQNQPCASDGVCGGR